MHSLILLAVGALIGSFFGRLGDVLFDPAAAASKKVRDEIGKRGLTKFVWWTVVFICAGAYAVWLFVRDMSKTDPITRLDIAYITIDVVVLLGLSVSAFVGFVLFRERLRIQKHASTSNDPVG